MIFFLIVFKYIVSLKSRVSLLIKSRIDFLSDFIIIYLSKKNFVIK